MHLALLVLIIFTPTLSGILLPKLLGIDKLRLGITIALGLELLLTTLTAMLPPLSFSPLLHIAPELTFAICSDGTSKLFACLFSALWLLIGTFSFDYLSTSHRQQRFFRYFLITETTLIGLCFAGNLISYLIFFEAMLFSTLPLLAHEETRPSRTSSLIYLTYTLLGASLVLLGFFFLAPYGGTQPFSPASTLTAAPIELIPLYFLMALGFGATAGLLPLDAWLPIAHTESPSPTSASISGAITVAGILGILRLTYYLFDPTIPNGTWAQTTLIVLAILTILTSSIKAFREPLLKRRLAHASTSQISCALLGLWLLSPEGLLGGLMQTVFHAIAKTCLFLFAGAFIHQTDKTKTYDLRGIGTQMPISAWCFAIAILSSVGIPPTGGFIANWHLAMGALSSPNLGLLPAITVILNALLTAAYLLPLVATMFFSTVQNTSPGVHEPSPLMTYPLIALAAALVILGLFSAPLTHAIQSMGLM